MCYCYVDFSFPLWNRQDPLSTAVSLQTSIICDKKCFSLLFQCRNQLFKKKLSIQIYKVLVFETRNMTSFMKHKGNFFVMRQVKLKVRLK